MTQRPAGNPVCSPLRPNGVRRHLRNLESTALVGHFVPRSPLSAPLTAENLERCYADGLERLRGNRRRRMQLESLGRDRAMFYLLAVSTGLRRGELASLTVGQLHLSALPTPYLDLAAEDAKSGRGASIPLRADVTDERREHLADRPPTIRIFDVDCQAAGIAKTDPRCSKAATSTTRWPTASVRSAWAGEPSS